MTEDDARWLAEIASLRAKNNVNWMNILLIAMKHAPDETRAELRKISDMDQRITLLASRIANADSETQDRPGSSAVYRR